MRSRSEPKQVECELYQLEFEQIINLDYSLIQLGMNLDWRSLEAVLGAAYRLARGAPRISERLIMALHRCAHPRQQMKLAPTSTRKLHTQLGRVLREIERKVTEPSEKLAGLLETAQRIYAQQRHAVSDRDGSLAGAKSFTGNPYDGYMLTDQIEQVKSMVGYRFSEACRHGLSRSGLRRPSHGPCRQTKQMPSATTLSPWMKRHAAAGPSVRHLVPICP